MVEVRNLHNGVETVEGEGAIDESHRDSGLCKARRRSCFLDRLAEMALMNKQKSLRRDLDSHLGSGTWQRFRVRASR